MKNESNLYRYPSDHNPINEYYEQIKKHKIIVCKKIRATYKYLIKIINNKKSIWEYDSSRANHAIEFIENYCKHSKGDFGGKSFILELWQKAIIAAIFGIVHKIEGTRKYKEVILLVGRKNGKSTLSAAIGLYMQFMDGEAGPEIVSAATKRDQSKIIWLEAKRMISKSPSLRKRSKRLVAEIQTEFNDGVFKPLSADSNTMDGLNPSCALIDELHAITKDLYDVIVDGTSARNEPLVFITTTAGTIREDIYDIKYSEGTAIIQGYSDGIYEDDRVLAVFYELDDRAEWTNSKMWIKANPGLGTIKKIDSLASKVKKAKTNAILIKNLLTKDFNMPDTSVKAWLTLDQINNTSTFDIEKLKPNYGCGGIDLSQSVDLTCATILFRIYGDDTLYVLQKYWLPEDVFEERSKEEQRVYEIWKEKGFLDTTPGNKINYKYITKWFVDIKEKYDIDLPFIGYDAWSSTYFVDDMKNYFGNAMIPVIQGKKTLSAPMKNLGADLISHKINYNNNPMLKWCICNTHVDIDRNDNIQPMKGKQGKRRIDGLASLLDAYVVYENNKLEYENIIDI